jgi:hypothetical protein
LDLSAARATRSAIRRLLLRRSGSGGDENGDDGDDDGLTVHERSSRA